MRLFLKLALILFAALAASPSLADDWTAARLFGRVLQLVDGQWQPLRRGDVVPDGNVVRTLALGRVTFTRGEETVDLGPNTQIQIFDKGTGKPFTTVKQYFGTVAVEAEVQQVQHFSVETPYLAAVVKGTRFTVKSGKDGASVSVQRGHVAVTDSEDHSHVLLSVGQSASVKAGKQHKGIAVSGGGTPAKVATPPARSTDTGTATPSGTATEAVDAKPSGSGDETGADSSGKSSGDSGRGSSGAGGGNDNSGKGSGNSGSGNSGNGDSEKDGDHGGKGKGGSSGSGGSDSSGKGSGNDGEDD